ncbi:MAG TPA: PAS domain S-box protein [Bacteroidales bacterium]|nr:PAS domain S-box protein [Bacteroidales bacterium]HPS17439.1 PAS domain S-box protein [Bacteroidales bacterium]
MDNRKELEAELKNIEVSSLSDEQVMAIKKILSDKKTKITPNNVITIDNKKGQKIENNINEFDNSFFNNFIDNNPIAFLICDSESKIIKVNKAAVDLFSFCPVGFYIFNNPIVEAFDLENKIKNVKKGNIESYPFFWFNGNKFYPEAPSKEICISVIMYPIYDKENNGVSNYVVLVIDITERKKAEEALVTSEEKYRQIFENIQAVYYEVDMNGNVIEVSPSVEYLTQYKRSELLGNNIENIYANSFDRKIFYEDLSIKGKVLNYKINIKNKDNSIIYTSVNAKLIKDSNGVPQKIVGAMLNISELVKTIDALNKSEERFREIYENTNDLIYTMDFQGTFTSANPSAKKLLGYEDDDEVQTLNMTEYLSPESSKIAFEDIHKKLIGEELNTVYEVDFLNTEGSYIPLEVNTMIRYKDGKPSDIFGIARDLTERKNALKALMKSEEKYRLIFENAPLGIMTADTDGNIIEINSTLLKLLGSRSIEETKSINVLTFQPLVDSGSAKAFKYCMETGDPVITDVTYTSKWGKTIEAKIYTKPIKDKNENITGFQVIAEDISEEKQAARQILDTLAEKEILLREIHHRVKNNMQIIISLINMQMQEINDEATIKKIGDLQQRVRTMSIIHEDLYTSEDLSKINFGNYLKKLSDSLHHTYSNELDVNLKLKLYDIFLGIDTAIPLGLIANELLNNSFKHAFPENLSSNKKNKIREIYIELKSSNNKNILIIGDNGIGIPNDNIAEYENTLGLMLVDILINQLKGKLKITKRNGTRFEISLDVEAIKPIQKQPSLH